jgi:hypothetical protein
MIPSYYEINVSELKKDGTYKHFFATSTRSITDEKTAEKIFEIFKEKFPFPQYRLDLSHVVCYATGLKTNI